MSDQAFHSILFPVDFSAASEATAPYVRGLVEQTGANVILLHVVPWFEGWYSAPGLRPSILSEPDLRNLQEQGALALELFREKFFTGISCHREVRSGSVAETITDTAINWGADLIMMPTRGLGRSRPLLIGSTTAKVLHDACCAVWTSPHLSAMKPYQGYKSIVCAVDREGIPRGYLEAATRLASCFDSKLTFVTAISSGLGGIKDEHRLSGIAVEFPQAQVHQIVDSVNCAVVSETGSVGEVVRRVAERHHADLVIENRGHLQHPFGRLRSHTYEIVLESPCPVLSLCTCVPQGSEALRTEGALETSTV